jgi:hypothetical protein
MDYGVLMSISLFHDNLLCINICVYQWHSVTLIVFVNRQT